MISRYPDSVSLLKVNCAAIPDHLLESELFGYEKGAFTGANPKGKPGAFELANHGTLMLDEIGEIPLHFQVKLLRAIQQKTITRLGGTKEIELDIRIITATNKDLEEEIRHGNFRNDLYYRINGSLRNISKALNISIATLSRKYHQYNIEINSNRVEGGD